MNLPNGGEFLVWSFQNTPGVRVTRSRFWLTLASPSAVASFVNIMLEIATLLCYNYV